MRDYNYNSSLNMPYYKVKNGAGIQEIAGLDKTLESLRIRYTDMQEREERALEMRKKAEEELEELKAKRKEEVRDEYVKELEDYIAEQQHSFTISDEKWNEIMKWQKEHVAEKHSYIDKNGEKQPKIAGAIGGRFSYTFVPTSIGIFAKCKCTCGEELDITEDV